MRLPLHRALPIAALLWIAALSYRQLPAGVCFDDAGDLQAASATLGVLHSPGYGGFALAGWLATKATPWMEPARCITLVCWLAGLAALWCTGRIVARALDNRGKNYSASVCGAAAILTLGSISYWRDALAAPEVYAPAMALLTASALLMIRPERRMIHEVAAFALLGLACGQRPPLLPTFAGYTALVLLNRARRGRRAVACAGVFVLAAGFSPLLVMLRDAQGAEYNYIEQFHRNEYKLPDRSAGLAALAARTWWLTSAEQFRFLLVGSVAELPARAAWTLDRVAGWGGPWLGSGVLLLAALGAVRLFGTGRSVHAIVALSVGAPALAYLIGTRMIDNAADFLPVQFACIVLLAGWLPRETGASAGADRSARAVAVLAVAVSVATSAFAWNTRAEAAREMDAQWFAQRLELGSLPRDATIVTSWRESTALAYEQLVRSGRRDVRIINCDESRWVEVTRRALAESGNGSREIFWVREFGAPPDSRLEPYRNIFRVVPNTQTEVP